MSEKIELPDALEFTPVPRVNRAGAWNAACQRAFIAALAETGSVRSAARAAGKTYPSAYQLRRSRGAESFRAAWDRALGEGVRQLRDVAFERATEGWVEPVFRGGVQVGERRIYDNRLLQFLIGNHERIGEGRGNGRRGAQWLAQDAAARDLAAIDPAAAKASLHAKLAKIEARVAAGEARMRAEAMARWTEEERAAWEADRLFDEEGRPVRARRV